MKIQTTCIRSGSQLITLPINTIYSEGCSCHESRCSETGDCCADIDVDYGLDTPTFQCVSQYGDNREPFYAVTSCPSEYPSVEIKSRCNTPIDEQTTKPGQPFVVFAIVYSENIQLGVVHLC